MVPAVAGSSPVSHPTKFLQKTRISRKKLDFKKKSGFFICNEAQPGVETGSAGATFNDPSVPNSVCSVYGRINLRGVSGRFVK